MSSMTPLNRSAIEASRARNPEATTSNRSVSERLYSASALTRFSKRVTLSFKASISNTIYEHPDSNTNCHNIVQI
ncbi:hypothetical protein CsSME_00042199 [Camellia sinensis var. sinensis]